MLMNEQGSRQCKEIVIQLLLMQHINFNSKQQNLSHIKYLFITIKLLEYVMLCINACDNTLLGFITNQNNIYHKIIIREY